MKAKRHFSFLTDLLTNLKLNVLQKMQDNVGKTENDRLSNDFCGYFVLMCLSVYLFSLFSFRLQHDTKIWMLSVQNRTTARNKIYETPGDQV